MPIDRDAILAGMTGPQTVRLSDGRMVTYRSVADLKLALEIADAEANATESRTVFSEYSSE